MRKITFIMLLILFFPTIIYAACPAPVGNVYTPIDASDTHVFECINAADAAAGGTVNIPAGTVTWTNYIYKMLNHDLVLSGAGINQTIINTTVNGPLFLGANGSVRLIIKDFRMNATASVPGGLLQVRGSSPNKVVKDMYFSINGRGITFGNPNDVTQGAGVISGCIFYNTQPTGQGIDCEGGATGSTYSWVGNPTFGTANALYIEGNTFNFANGPGDGAFDAYNGAKVVFRYNTVIGTQIGWHGNDSGVSAHSVEVYHNSFTGQTRGLNALFNLRGGTAVIWGNTVDSSYSPTIVLSLYRSCIAQGRDSAICYKGSGSGAPHDGNIDATGYRCYQQPGTTGSDGITQWPLIEWDNYYNGVKNDSHSKFALSGQMVGSYCVANGGNGVVDMTTHVREGRDYINHDTCVGVSSAFCTTWWDDVNKQAKNYTPYAYPHPLTLTAGPPPPRNMHIGQ